MRTFSRTTIFLLFSILVVKHLDAEVPVKELSNRLGNSCHGGHDPGIGHRAGNGDAFG
jgi:hypothetical protein